MADVVKNPEISFEAVLGEIPTDYINFKSWKDIVENGEQYLQRIHSERWKKLIKAPAPNISIHESFCDMIFQIAN